MTESSFRQPTMLGRTGGNSHKLVQVEQNNSLEHLSDFFLSDLDKLEKGWQSC